MGDQEFPQAIKEKIGDAAESMADKAGSAAKSAVGNAAKAVQDAVSEDGAVPGPEPESDKKKKSAMPIIAIVAALAIAVVVGFALIAPGAGSKFGKDDFLTSSMLEKAVDIDRLSTAEFVFNGIAEHHTTTKRFIVFGDEDTVDYRVSYKATVTAGVNMKDIEFVIDDSSKKVAVTMPPITLESRVNPDGMNFIPSDVDANIQDIISLCEDDVMYESSQSGELTSSAKEALKSTIEAILTPFMDKYGYEIEWASAAAGAPSETSGE